MDNAPQIPKHLPEWAQGLEVITPAEYKQRMANLLLSTFQRVVNMPADQVQQATAFIIENRSYVTSCNSAGWAIQINAEIPQTTMEVDTIARPRIHDLIAAFVGVPSEAIQITGGAVMQAYPVPKFLGLVRDGEFYPRTGDIDTVTKPSTDER